MNPEQEAPIEVEYEYSIIFHLSTPTQIPIVRSIAPELLRFSTAELLHSARANNLTIKVPLLSMWRARGYSEKAKAAGIESKIVDEN